MAAHVQPLADERTAGQSAWSALASHYRKVSKLHLRQLFADDPKRGDRMAIDAAGLYLDYSKNRVTDETLRLLFQLAKECGLRARIDAMFSGEKINTTEGAQSCIPRCGLRRTERFWWMERMLYPKCMRCSTAWLTFPIVCATENGRVIPENVFAASSISESEGQTSAL